MLEIRTLAPCKFITILHFVVPILNHFAKLIVWYTKSKEELYTEALKKHAVFSCSIARYKKGSNSKGGREQLPLFKNYFIRKI